MVKELAERCNEAAEELRTADTGKKNRALEALAALLAENEADILAENQHDIAAARESGMSEALIDRLTLNPKRIAGMANGIRKVVTQPDPIGGADFSMRHPNGMTITRKRVPLGVVGVIYESRTNVTVDVAALCIKSGNACLLRGGKEALRSNTVLARLACQSLESAGLPADGVCLITDTNRSSAVEMMGLTGLLDVLIARGGAGLIKTVVENAKVPVIETGWGNCHVYVDTEADLPMAVKILVNAKCSRPSVCNAAETLLVARPVAEAFLPRAATALAEYGVRIHGCPETLDILKKSSVDGILLSPASESDWETEYNDYDLAARVVGGLYQATAHIKQYGSKHSESIVTKNYFTARRFCDRVDAAAVYINASTRFTDGEEFGLGAEIGISTQKLHVRGPMGLAALTSERYIIEGEGQVRE